MKNVKIAIAGTGYVGLSIATLFQPTSSGNGSRCNSRKSRLNNQRKSPIQDDYI